MKPACFSEDRVIEAAGELAEAYPSVRAII